MFIVNTSFHLLEEVERDFILWAKESYMPSARSVGEPALLKILTAMSPEMRAYSVQLTCHNLEKTMDWHDGDGARLREELTGRYGERVVFFTTCMEVVE